MNSLNPLCIYSFLISVSLFLAFTNAAQFTVRNNCPYTVWAAAIPGGGQQLNSGQTWVFNVNAGTTGGRVWGRTGCSFDRSGRGGCQTGDCGGNYRCTGYSQPPNTLAEFSLSQFNNLDFYDISLVDGFNVPMDFSSSCRAIRCTADINGQCPSQLRAPGGCNNPCTVYKTDQYCCNSGTCGPTDLSKFFKDRCRDAYSYPKDDQTSTFSCQGGGNYRVTFCPIKTAQFTVRNNCPYTVWAAAVPGGGQQLNSGQTWTFNVNATVGRVWGRTGCSFDGSGRGRCQTGDCGGKLRCTGYGQPPNTLAEFALNQFNNLDSYDILLVDGFNVPMDFSSSCRGIWCTADINGQCPSQLKAPGGCNNPCTVYKTDQYCCNSGNCRPTDLSKFFKARCPDAYSYPKDNKTSTFTCQGGGNYRVTFCPQVVLNEFLGKQEINHE